MRYLLILAALIFAGCGGSDDSTVGETVDEAVEGVDASSAELGRDAEGGLLVGMHAGDLVRMTMASPSKHQLMIAKHQRKTGCH